MTIEEWFVKEYEKAKKAVIELEKNAKEREIERNDARKRLKEAVEFIKKSEPRFVQGGFLHLSSHHLDGEKKDEAVSLLKKLGIGIGKED